MLLLLASSGLTGCASGAPVEVPRGLDHAPYDQLLQRYVNDRGLVDYARWKASAADLQALRAYTAGFAAGGAPAGGAERSASLINAYNALTLRWILDNYPVRSIKATSNPWGAKRWQVGGRRVSLDEIEHDALRPSIGYQAHAVLVCAARSCPPLWNHAYRAAQLDVQLAARWRAWLARSDLNRFAPDAHQVDLSQIFRWYRDDFDAAPGGLRAVVAKYAPAQYGDFLQSDYRVTYLPYDWSLNEP